MKESVKSMNSEHTPEWKKEANTDVREEFGKEKENLEKNQSEIL